jgi:hypothetical protein
MPTGVNFSIMACPICERSIRVTYEEKRLDGIEIINLVDFLAGFLE